MGFAKRSRKNGRWENGRKDDSPWKRKREKVR
jgi:hypothetical protein